MYYTSTRKKIILSLIRDHRIKARKQERSSIPKDILVNIKSLLHSIPTTELGIKCPLVYFQV